METGASLMLRPRIPAAPGNPLIVPMRGTWLVGLALLCAACDGSSPVSVVATATPSAPRPSATSAATATHSPTPPPTSTSPPSSTATSTPTASPSASASATGSATPTPQPTAPAVACEDLVGDEFGEARVLAAASVAATASTPAYCRVSGLIAPKLNFELRLPAGWNRKVVFIGGGGFDGTIPSPDMGGSPGIVAAGYATIATDSGHQASPLDGSWALDDDEAIADWADRARRRVLAAARPIIAAHFGRSILRTYFEGGSNGGREALLEAQRRPEDYDGIIARSPAHSWTALMLAGNRLMKQLFRSEGGYLDPAALRAIGRSVLAQCDGLDGLEDGIVARPDACDRVSPPPLCATPGPDCLTSAQLATLAFARGDIEIGLTLANGIDRHAGYPPSGEEDTTSSWPLWLTGFTGTPSSLLFTLQDHFIRYFVVRDAGFDSLDFEPAQWTARLQELSAQIDATADLNAFAERGGKVILWHGVADAAISASETVRYAERAATAPPERDFLRLYLAPGVDHTSGGRGAAVVDLVGALDAWVEGGEIGHLEAFRPGGNAPFRPLCAHPYTARYSGGDPGAASSFRCTQD